MAIMTFDPWEDPPLTLERDEPPPPPPRQPGLGRTAIIGGVVAACVLGLGLGLAAKPDLIGLGSKPAPMQPRPATSQGSLDIVAAEPAPLPPLPDRPPLETMSPELIDAAPKPPPPIPRAQAEPEPQPERAPQPEFEAAPPEPVRMTRPSFDCRRATSPAEDMVCADPALASADRRLARAFQRAVRAGAPYDQLRSEQDDWLDIREDAAQRSPRALAAVYEQRIEELNALTDDVVNGGWRP